MIRSILIKKKRSIDHPSRFNAVWVRSFVIPNRTSFSSWWPELDFAINWAIRGKGGGSKVMPCCSLSSYLFVSFLLLSSSCEALVLMFHYVIYSSYLCRHISWYNLFYIIKKIQHIYLPNSISYSSLPIICQTTTTTTCTTTNNPPHHL